MIFSPKNADDISRYYRHTYVKFHETGDKIFFIRDVNNHMVRGTDDEGTEFELYLSEEFPYEVDYVIPRKSFFQHKNKACLLQRHPAKQYQRGLSHHNTQIHGLSRTGAMNAMDVNFDVLKSYVAKQEFPSFDRGITVKGKNVSVVLSPRFAYVPDIKQIFADLIPVASVDHPNHRIEVFHSVFMPEIQHLASNSIFKVVAYGTQTK
jgi:hypothetical protein